MASLNDIRTTFLSYFEGRGHKVVPSSPLVPRNDPTLMFTNSGMVQFKNVFTGVEVRDYKRATTSQKCVRAGGKHNDLDNVGYTSRHHTFFEMLGNFSFGDYFKEKAIAYCWDLMTKEYGIPADRMLVTIYHDDDESADLWRRYAGLPDERIIRIATSDNFWSMGPTGPCGPCTEVYYDYGEGVAGGPPGSADEDGDRFVEIWNLVLMQFEQFEDGSRVPLPKPSIDTGMGLERIGALLQGKHDNYDTDLFRKLIESSANASSTEPDGSKRIHHRVIADHLRSMSFLVAEGVLPSKDGRGYVLRRIMRRAMRHAHLLGVKEPLLHRLVRVLVAEMGNAFPELPQAQTLIEDTCYNEEKRFQAALSRGLRLLDDELEKLSSNATLPGEIAFKLYDTYGFPLDLTQDALRERGRTVDESGFTRAMNEQRERARASWVGSGEAAEARIWFELADEFGPTEFLGYETENAEGQILAIVQGGQRTECANTDANAELIINQTPFYAEAGGQVGDTGRIVTPEGTAKVTDTYKRAGLYVHAVKVERGRIECQHSAELAVDGLRRQRIRGTHSGTHLLHEALRRKLGVHVSQRGSLNSDGRLRFDFSHNKAMNLEELRAVEDEVNAMIQQNSEVETRIMTPDEARDIGAVALFGEKYGDEVRVVSMGTMEGSGKGRDGNTYSMELCGGTHVDRTGEIGLFVATGESASAAGVRRIEAITGDVARNYLADQDHKVAEVALLLKAGRNSVVEKVKSLLDERKALSAEVERLRKELAVGGTASGSEKDVTLKNGISLTVRLLNEVAGRDLPDLVDDYKNQNNSGVVLIVSDVGGKAAVAAGVTGDLVDRVSAIDIVRTATPYLGGKGGGGRPDFAQGGGSRAQGAEKAAEAVENLLGRLT